MHTPSTFAVGDLRVHTLCDGISKLPASHFKDADWSGHEAELDADRPVNE